VSPQAGSVPVVIIGATGRMGLSLLRILSEFPEFRLHAAVASPESRWLGKDSGELAGVARNEVPVVAELPGALGGAGLAVDFSTAAAAGAHVEMSAALRVPLLLGTTGLTDALGPILEHAAERIPLLVAPNTSLGASVLEDLVQRAAARLGAEFSIRIQDTHHRDKADAPSGTALALGRTASVARGGAGGAIQYASVREGNAIGQHLVEFSGPGERLGLSHEATDRGVFARGALRAGLWLTRQGPGRHHMADIFI
jgi:4-hydroxy-tetrahydrodipicolinate reductase